MVPNGVKAIEHRHKRIKDKQNIVFMSEKEEAHWILGKVGRQIKQRCHMYFTVKWK